MCSPLPPCAHLRSASGACFRLPASRIPAGARSTKIHRNLYLCSSKSKRHANCWRACTFVIYDYRGNWFLERVSKYFYS